MSQIFLKTRNFTKFVHFRPQNHNRLISLSIAKKSKVIEEDEDKPIKYSTSKAATWRAEVTRSGDARSAPWFEPYVISLSLAIFMIYFFYLREENDVDREFDKTLYDRISGLEEKQLEIVLRHNLENNLPVKDIQDRLKEIREENT